MVDGTTRSFFIIIVIIMFFFLKFATRDWITQLYYSSESESESELERTWNCAGYKRVLFVSWIKERMNKERYKKRKGGY